METVTLTCNRCGKARHSVVMLPSTAQLDYYAGFYRVSAGSRFARYARHAGEVLLCQTCMGQQHEDLARYSAHRWIEGAGW